MIKVKPNIEHTSACPHCKTPLQPNKIIWHNFQICVEANSCPNCQAQIIEHLRVGHGVDTPYQVDLHKDLCFGDKLNRSWLGLPFLKSLKSPNSQSIELTKEIITSHKKVIILNCLDFLYGHSLLKLLNAQRHLEDSPELGLIVIIPPSLKWLLPSGLAEIWTVNIPLKTGRDYYPKLNQLIEQETERFDEIYVSKAYSHPSKFDLSKFTKIPQYQFNAQRKEVKITFIWREDRLWVNSLLMKLLEKFKGKKLGIFFQSLGLSLQNQRIQELFQTIKTLLPSAQFYVAGLGTKTNFPVWVQDSRVEKFDAETESKLCQIYADSDLVIGVHGSNMLLPSGHAGMTLDLMPSVRWRNFTQDILYQETDPRIAAFRYRYLPIQTNISEIAHITWTMIQNRERFYQYMTADQ